MSLVAYESSDEESDDETETTADRAIDIEQNVKSLTKKPESEFASYAISRSSISSKTHSQQNQDTLHGKKGSLSLSSKLPPPRFTTTINITLQSNQNENGPHNGGSTSETKPLGNVNKRDNSHEKLRFESNSDEEEIIDIEEYVPPAKTAKPELKPKNKEETLRSVGSLFSLLPPPWKTESPVEVKVEVESKDVQTKKHPVRISIPTAPEVESDEEGDEPASKKQKHSKVGSGLSSLLPKPKHSVTVKSNPNKPAAKLSNRPLIPYTLSKKSSVTKATHKKEGKTAKTVTEGEISDEDEPTSFFSFEDKKPEREIKQSIVNSGTVESQKFHPNDNSSISLLSTNISSTISVESQNTESLAAQTEKHSFNSAVDVSNDHKDVAESSAGESYSSATGPYYDVRNAEMASYYGAQTASHDQQSSYNYTGYNIEHKSLPSEGYSKVEDYSYDSQTQPVIEQGQIDMEKLKRLQGKKNRGEKIDIIDINAHDQVGNNEIVMTKMATEEITHRPSKKKGDLPSAQQRRKHQITYLAHQAKEREFELRNQWASNRQTRKQTQSKYGF